MPGPLDGIKILDLTSVGFGPFAAQILGDYGAEIIKIETQEGDITRGITPFVNQGMGHFFVMANRNKRCIVLDLKADKGRKAFLKLVELADAIICSVRPAAMERLGLGPDVLLADNPKLVYGRMTGWGQSGPMAQAAGWAARRRSWSARRIFRTFSS